MHHCSVKIKLPGSAWKAETEQLISWYSNRSASNRRSVLLANRAGIDILDRVSIQLCW